MIIPCKNPCIARSIWVSLPVSVFFHQFPCFWGGILNLRPENQADYPQSVCINDTTVCVNDTIYSKSVCVDDTGVWLDDTHAGKIPLKIVKKPYS